MKQRRKAILALLLSASVAASPIVSATSVFAEDLDFATVEETEVTSEDAGSDFSDDSISIEDSDDVTEADTADDSILIDNSDSAEYSESDTDVFSAGDEVDAFTAADEVSVQADEEAKTHSIKVTVVNSKGVVSGMYAMDNAIITKQDDGTYLVKMHQASENREYMALTNDITAATQHRVDWYVADSNWYYTIPVANLTDPVYASFSYAKNVNKGSKWGNVQTITFDTSSMADTTEPDVDASGMNKQVALDYTAADAALASVPEDLSIYTDETAKAVTDAVNKLKGNYKATQQSDVDTLVTALTDAVKALRKKAVSLTVTNKTGMFNVTDAVLDNDKLIVTLHGTGYHYLYKGTYEEAVENGDNRDKWIAGDNSSGKWQFTIPVAKGETFVPIVAISHSYLTKYEQGKNSLERAFYPRQAVIDQNAATLVTGDYDHTKNLTVTNNVKMFKVDTASLETIGGPNSNNYKEILHLTMGSTSFDKVFIGSAVDAAAAETTTDITDQKADLTVKANAMGGEATVDYLEKEVIFSFHSVKNDSWYERVFNVNKTNGTLTITPVSVPATSITLNASSQNLITGESFTLTATVEPAKTTDTVVWSSSNEAVATVSDGTVTAAKAGTTEITATAGNVKATCTVTVSDPVYKVTDIKLTAAPSRRIAAGKKVKLKASIAPSNATDKSVTWTSSNKKVATVNAKGLVTFKKNAGGKKVTITATAKDGSKKFAKITLTCMKGSVKSIKLSGKTTVKSGKTTKLKAKVSTKNGKANKTVVWSSSNTKLATVDKNGKVKTVKGKKGTVKITAKATDGSGKKATIKIKIK
ncbi:Ig-like domain-containing protein [Blautia intestinalis]|uniref:Ig-like domain-containing protein n=1 Tax=Blautia intestinalis TaxID=2763028 RepID=UPI0022E420FE|nr:Ig-like domain-containing protein [Blautia intestinalis]